MGYIVTRRSGGRRSGRCRATTARNRHLETGNSIGEVVVGVEAPSLRGGQFGDELAEGLVVVDDRETQGAGWALRRILMA